MVQGDKKHSASSGAQRTSTSYRQTSKRTAPPATRKRKMHDHATTAAIGANIQHIMAARLVHSGGRLRVVAAPAREEIQGYVKSGIQLGSKHHRDLIASNMARSRRTAKQNGLPRHSSKTTTNNKSESVDLSESDEEDVEVPDQRTVFDIETEAKASDSDEELEHYFMSTSTSSVSTKDLPVTSGFDQWKLAVGK